MPRRTLGGAERKTADIKGRPARRSSGAVASQEPATPPTLDAPRAFITLDGELDVSHLEPQRSLGRGGSAEVFAARDPRLGRTVALKVLASELRDDPTRVGRFLREARIIAQLEHPHIVPLYGLERTDAGDFAFTMRLVEGWNFAEYLAACSTPSATQERSAGLYDLKSRLEILAKVCDALAYAHDRGVIHRDVKPSNIMIGGHHEVYLVDWGIARVTTSADGSRLADSVPPATPMTEHGAVIGTPLYMAPEQARGDVASQGPALDQFAMGLIIQEAASLQPPRPRRTVSEVLSAARIGRHGGQTASNAQTVPPALVAIIDRATQFHAEDRYPSLRALADDLRRFIRDEPVSVYREPVGARFWRLVGQRPQLTLALLLACVCLGLGVTTWSLRRTVETQTRSARAAEARTVLTAHVLHRGDELEARFDRMRRLAEALAAKTEELVLWDRPTEVPRYTQADLQTGRAPSDMREGTWYRIPVSFEHPVYTLAAGSTPEDVEPIFSRLGPLHAYLRTTVLRSRGPDAEHLSPAAQNQLLGQGAPLRYATVAFENGLMLSFPGFLFEASLSSAYDPRIRPWYRSAIDKLEPTCAEPYFDLGTEALLLPCYRAMRRPDGALLGVAGVDMALDDLVGLLDMPNLDGFREASLVSRSGSVLVSPQDRGLRSAAGSAPSSAAERPRVREPALLTALLGETAAGQLHVGDELIVFDHLSGTDLALVVHVAASAYDGH